MLCLLRWISLHDLCFYSANHRTTAHMSIPNDPLEDVFIPENSLVYDEHLAMLQRNELRNVNDPLNDVVYSSAFRPDLAHHIDEQTLHSEYEQ